VPEPAEEDAPTAEAPLAAEAPAAQEQPAAVEEPAAQEQPAAVEEAKAEPSQPATAAESMAPRNLSDATPSPLPPRKPEMIPPGADFDRHDEVSQGSSKLRIAIPVALASAIAGLIAVLAYRRKR